MTVALREAAYENSADVVVLEWPGPGVHRPSDRNVDDLVADPRPICCWSAPIRPARGSA